MFGGLAFMVAGHMAVSASRQRSSCSASIRPRPTPWSLMHGRAGSSCGREMAAGCE